MIVLDVVAIAMTVLLLLMLVLVGPPGIGSYPTLHVTTFVGVAALTNRHMFKFYIQVNVFY